MGFSIVGNSGDSSSTTNVFNTTNTASINPQFDEQGAAGGSLALDLAPTLLDASLGTYAPSVTDYYAPLNIVSTGDNYGDSALATLAQISGQQLTAQQGAPASAVASTTSLPSDWVYYALGAVVLLFLAHGKG